MDLDKLSRAVRNLSELVSRLRGPGGCPWDAEQTDSTIKMYLLEEAYEVLDAVEKGSAQELCLELGDLLFQILFLARLAEERGDFDLVDVAEGITEKMIRRHPHVFGDTEVTGSDQVARNWARIKKEENHGSENNASKLSDIPVQLPALMRGHRLGERAAKSGLDIDDEASLWQRVGDRMEELKGTPSGEKAEDFERAFGDLTLALVEAARRKGHNSENLLREANQRFVRRFEKAERILRDRGVDMEDATREQKKRAWDEAGDKEESI